MLNKPYLSGKHVILELAAYVITIITFVVVLIFAMTHADAQVPTDIGFGGEVYEYGSPYTLLAMPLILLIIDITLTLTLHVFPITWMRIPFAVKPEKQTIVMYFVTLSNAIAMVLTSLWFLAMCILCMFGQFALLPPVAIAMVTVIIIVCCGGMIIAYKYNR